MSPLARVVALTQLIPLHVDGTPTPTDATFHRVQPTVKNYGVTSMVAMDAAHWIVNVPDDVE